MRIPFDSEKALQLNEKIMETIYYAAMTASNDISKERKNGMMNLVSYFEKNKDIPEFYNNKFEIVDSNISKLYHKLKPNKYELMRDINERVGSYSSFEGSPVSKGIFQYDMWGLDDSKLNHNWHVLKINVKKYGIRNSLLVALMPTASTSQILGNNECFEHYTSNIYTRNTLAGDFPIINKHMVNDLNAIGEWNVELKDLVIAGNGSIQHIKKLPKVYRRLYQTQWELKQIWVLKAAKARGPFVDQSQSMNIFMEEPNDQKLNSCLFWGWKNGLKSGIYYLRSKPSSNAIKFTIDPSIMKELNNSEECEMCSA
jgi:ribonucleoside-diphosphate reductase alpha chain